MRRTCLLFGSDSPATASYGNLPGFNGRLQKELWTVDAGKRAHLLLRANPLVSVEAYDAIATVIHAGRPIERQALSARRRR